MAKSGDFLTSGWYSESFGDYVYLQFSWTATQSVEANASTISWTVKCTRKVSGRYIMAGAFKVVIDGETVYSKGTDYRIQLYNGTVVASGTKTITHTADGTRSFSASVQGALYSRSVNVTGSKTFTLDTIPRASSVTATNANIGSDTTISIARASSSFTHTISYVFGSLSGTIATKTAATSIQWTVPTSFYNQIRNSPSGECVINCITYNGSTQIGTSTRTVFVATADKAICSPGVSVSSEDVNAESTALTQNKKKIISGISKLRVITTATAKNGASITSISAYCGTTKLTGANVTFNGAASAAVYVIVTDSRGYSTRVDDDSLSLINYIAPTINPTVSRLTPTGDTVKVTVTGKWFNGSLGGVANTLKVTVRRKKASEESHHTVVEMPITTNGNDYTATVNLTGIAYTDAYSFLIRLDDKIFTDENGYRDAKYSTVPLSKGIPVFDWGENDFRFNVPVKLTQGPLADYVIEETDTGKWHYRKWASGVAEAWYHDTPTPSGFTTLVATGIYSNDKFSNVLVDMPSGAFALAPTNASINAASNVIMLGQIASISATQLSYRLWTSYSTTPSRILVQIYVFGRWKQ